MINTCKYSLLLIFSLLLNYSGFAQFIFNSGTNPDISATFLKHKMESTPDKPIFNVLTIKNNKNQKISFNLNFTLPENWTLLGGNYDLTTLEPNDSIKIPVGITISNQAKGNIAYVIVASLTDKNGNELLNEYAFVSIPHKSDLDFKLIDRVLYFDASNHSTVLKYKIQNNGNVDELFKLDFLADKNLDIEGGIDNNYSLAVFLQARKDTILQTTIQLKNTEEALMKKLYRAEINVTNNGILLNNSVLLKNLNNTLIFPIPEDYKILTAELYARNIFSSSQVFLSPSFNGSFLLKKGRSIYYNFKDNHYSNSGISLLKSSFLYVGYKEKNYELVVGDIYSTSEQNLSGRGMSLQYQFAKYSLNAIVSKNVLRDVYNYGLNSNIPLNKKISLKVGLSYSDDTQLKIKSSIYNLGTRVSIKNQNLYLFYSFSNAAHNFKNKMDKLGHGLLFNYSLSSSKLRISFDTRAGTSEFTGSTKGRVDIIGQVNYLPKNNQNLFLNLRYNLQNPAIYYGDSLIPERRTLQKELNLEYGYNLLPQIYAYTQLGVLVEKTNSYYQTNTLLFDYNEGAGFDAQNFRFKFGFKIRNESKIYIHPSIMLGKGKIVSFLAPKNNLNFIPNTDFKTFEANLNVNSNFGGLYLTYYTGPYNLFEQYSFFYTNNSTNFLRVTPYYNGYIYKKQIRWVSQLSLSSNFTTQFKRISLNNQLFWYLKNGWSIHVSNNFSYLSSVDNVTGDKYRYAYSYSELGIRKDVFANQPRYKLCDLKVVFYIDLNGNRKHDKNEPGVKNVLVNMEKDVSSAEFETASESFSSAELLTDYNGEAFLTNIPSGMYKIMYNPLDKSDKYITEKSSEIYKIDKSQTIEIPFYENYKLFGRVVLTRSSLSNLGTVDISNIRVTAKDDEGKIYPTLTDAKGNFTLYVPHANEYEVSINNIFYESFNLQQSVYKVFFNGYKQFELTFQFNEKERKILFEENYGSEELKSVNRASIKGIVKDLGTLKPLKASIEIIDNITKNIVTSTITNAETGAYATIFLSSEGYNLVVKSDGYETYSEPLYLDQVSSFQILTKNIMLRFKKKEEIKK